MTDQKDSHFRCGYIAIVGRPNVGKSTLMNELIGAKVSITSRKAQTTRHRIMGIQTDDDAQFVYVDTPGFQTRYNNALNKNLNRTVKDTLSTADVIVFVVDAGVYGPADQQVLDLIPESVPAILVINKIDTVEKETLLPVIAAYKDLLDFTDVIPISAKWHDGLDSLMQVCENFAQPGPFMFPEGISTDMPEKQVMAEIIREKLLWNLEKEIPHGTAVEITKFSERDDGIIDIDATIYCEKASHKGIIIGKQGAMLKKISSQARADCERFMGTKVYLQTWVRVKENWRDSQFLISNFGYDARQ